MGCTLAAFLGLAASAFALDGVLDPGFGGDGIVTTTVAPGNGDESGPAIAIQADGKLVVAGFADMDPTGAIDFDFTLARYHPDGSLDSNADADPGVSFGGDGIVTTDISSATNELDRIFDVAIQPSNGKIVVAGDSPGSGGLPDFTLARYNTDGSLDSTTDADPGTSFGGDGVVTTPVAPSMGGDGARGVVIQGDGKIVAAGEADFGGTTDFDFTLVRYNADGTLDPGFDGDLGNPGGGDGIVATDFGLGDDLFDGATSVAIQPSGGKIVAAGEVDTSPTDSDFGLARYNTNGALDTNADADPGVFFDTDGKLTTSFGTESQDVQDVAIQPSDGKIIAVGGSSGGSGVNFALTRYLPATGGLDAGFDGDPGNPGGGDGKVITVFPSGGSNPRGTEIAPDGKLVVAGSADSDPSASGNLDFAAARYLAANGTLDSSFSGDGTVTATVAPALNLDGARDVKVQSDGKVIAFGSADFGAGTTGADWALVRWGPEPSPAIAPPAITPTPAATAPRFDLAAAKRKCKKKFPPGPKRKRCIKKAKQKAAQQA